MMLVNVGVGMEKERAGKLGLLLPLLPSWVISILGADLFE
jgi:hypothetical protein